MATHPPSQNVFLVDRFIVPPNIFTGLDHSLRSGRTIIFHLPSRFDNMRARKMIFNVVKLQIVS